MAKNNIPLCAGCSHTNTKMGDYGILLCSACYLETEPGKEPNTLVVYVRTMGEESRKFVKSVRKP